MFPSEMQDHSSKDNIESLTLFYLWIPIPSYLIRDIHILTFKKFVYFIKLSKEINFL